MRILVALLASLLLVSVAAPARADRPVAAPARADRPVAAPARADHPAIDLRIVVPAGGTSFPERDGTPVRLGPSLLTAPFTVTSARAVGSEVQLTLAPATARGFAALTQAHRGDRLAILAGGVVQSAPVIRDPITGGQVSITLRSPADATALARSFAAR